jgi:transcriptional accessory protein Tex/SPT6
LIVIRGEVVVVLAVQDDSEFKASEQLAAQLSDKASSKTSGQRVTVFKTNYKAKNKQVSVLYRLEQQQQQTSSQQSNPSTKTTTTTRNAMNDCAEEIIQLLEKKLNMQVQDRALLSTGVQQVLGRFQTEAYIRGYEAKLYADKHARMQAPL